jgi:hypothetical protein
MGRIAAVFLADGAETRERHSVSEWGLDPNTQGPGRARSSSHMPGIAQWISENPAQNAR